MDRNQNFQIQLSLAQQDTKLITCSNAPFIDGSIAFSKPENGAKAGSNWSQLVFYL
tara:strand:- start:1337 stop:1504 length:168 start_codon:yes stop_codon:yes gene_type:complete